MRWKAPGLRLPITDPEPPPKAPCDRDASHSGGIRFELHRYGKKVGQIRLCERCIRDIVLRPDPDPLHVEAA
jgi:hypothetical protein